MSIAKHHAEWLSLIEVSGPFLSLPVLVQRFPQGMDSHDTEHAKALRQVYEEWDQDQHSDRPDPAIHRQWIDWVLGNTLDLDDVLVEGQNIPQTLKADLAEHGETLRPDKVVMERDGSKARLLIQTYPLRQKLSRVVEGKPWAASPDTRMMQLLHDTGVRIGLVTNGDQWMLVDAPKGETTGYASWYASLWLEEPKTLQAFRTLLSSYRFFGVPEEETLERLLAQSAEHQQEVTEQLGYQVRRAVEVLVQSIDRANRDSGGALLKGVPEERLYEAALTVMMRLVFLFCAEERELLLLGDELYDKNFAVSTLREQLRGAANNFGEEVLERRHDAWSRLLTTFRAVYGGIQHPRLKLPAYKGELFDPDRFPFLEGRTFGTSWKDTPCQPIPVDNRTTLHLLEALQVLQVRLPGGGPATPRKLSFRALSILQIGHVYEGLLDHTAVKATEPVLGLNGPRDHEPEVPLSKLEILAAKGEDEVLAFVKEETGRSSVAPIKRFLGSQPDDVTLSRFRTVCHGDEKLWQRIKPFAGLVRLDTFEYPVVVLPGSVYVTAGTDRRSSGTHYTPESLTEPIVRYTLEPLVYEGPADGKPKEQWRLRSPRELLDLKICDMACGSGAFLVQVCIYLAERLLEAWEAAEKRVEGSPRITPYGEVSTGLPEEQLIPLDREERLTYARRLVAERCVYGVDKNPLAVEMAKLSLWLLTLAKDKPFTFLDHAIRCGDSLVGLSSIDQLLRFSMTEGAKVRPLMEQQRQQIEKLLQATMLLRKQIETLPSNTPQDIERKSKMLENVEDQTKRLRYAADMLLAATWDAKNASELESALNGMLAEVEYKFKELPGEQLEADAGKHLRKAGIAGRFHWALEFPEVFVEIGGFNAFVGNPPFRSGSRISTDISNAYIYWLKKVYPTSRGNSDLCCYFILRASSHAPTKGSALGLVCTNSISQGDNRITALIPLLESGWRIHFAKTDLLWPGTANLYVSLVGLTRSDCRGGRASLNEREVGAIGSSLTEEDSLAEPYALTSREGIAYKGVEFLGEGFRLNSDLAEKLLVSPEEAGVVRPWLNGADLTDGPVLPRHYAIDFADLSMEEASKHKRSFEIVESTVKPVRATDNRAARRDRWWQYGEKAIGMREAISSLKRVLVRPFLSDTFFFEFVSTEFLLTNTLIVVADDRWLMFGILGSSLHESWARQHGSSLKLDFRYTPSKCFLTFPFLEDREALDDRHPRLSEVAKEYGKQRKGIILAREEGLTKTYNRFNNTGESAADIQKLRDLHVEMDKAVAAAYGWSDLDLGHGFHETKQGVRFTISEPARREVLTRLLKLNHERHTEEVAQGLHDKGKSKPKATGRKGKKAPSSDEKLLF
jgi:hypothetical protein